MGKSAKSKDAKPKEEVKGKKASKQKEARAAANAHIPDVTAASNFLLEAGRSVSVLLCRPATVDEGQSRPVIESFVEDLMSRIAQPGASILTVGILVKISNRDEYITIGSQHLIEVCAVLT